ncbi:hypothetical protein ACH5RR_021359 [Cinchona calisaya]|uniref:Uncharacterized protein n=1 Tax=Cinchona calisaya TaxID=153742 RepID=A0ABD2ZKB6_9GENT
MNNEPNSIAARVEEKSCLSMRLAEMFGGKLSTLPQLDAVSNFNKPSLALTQLNPRDLEAAETNPTATSSIMGIVVVDDRAAHFQRKNHVAAHTILCLHVSTRSKDASNE